MSSSFKHNRLNLSVITNVESPEHLRCLTCEHDLVKIIRVSQKEMRQD